MKIYLNNLDSITHRPKCRFCGTIITTLQPNKIIEPQDCICVSCQKLQLQICSQCGRKKRPEEESNKCFLCEGYVCRTCKIFMTNNRVAHRDCFLKEGYRYCDICGIGMTEWNIVDENQYLCEHCLDDSYFWCEYCETYRPNHDCREIGDYTYCTECTTICESCEENVLIDETTKCDSCGMILCPRCAISYEDGYLCNGCHEREIEEMEETEETPEENTENEENTEEES